MANVCVLRLESKSRPAGAEAGAVHRARINKKFTVEITATRLGIFCEWIPEVPRKLSRTEFERYRRARHEAVVELANKYGVTIAIIEA